MIYEVVSPVIANHNHGKERASSTDGTNTSIQLAGKCTVHPVSLHKCVDCDRGSHSEHHDTVRQGKVDNKHISGGSQILGLQEDENDQSISKEVDEPENEEKDAKDMSDKRVLRRVLGPVVTHHFFQILRDVEQLVCT